MNTPDTEWEKSIQILDVKLEGLFNDAVRQCLRFVRKEQTEEEMKSELKSLNSEGLEHIRRALSSRDTYWKERVRKEVEGLQERFGDWDNGDENEPLLLKCEVLGILDNLK